MTNTNEQIINRFVSGATEGHNSNRTIFIEGDTIYSYGRHFPVATRHGNVILITSDEYSVTTARHVSLVRRAANDYIEVPHILNGELKHGYNTEHLQEQVNHAKAKGRKARSPNMIHMWILQAERHQNQLNRYREIFEV